jgi:hypothetical protein
MADPAAHRAQDHRSPPGTALGAGQDRLPPRPGALHRPPCAQAFFAAAGITVQRVLTDNGSCYRSRLWRDTLTAAGIRHKRTRPYRPQTNGKVERLNRTLLDEWAHAGPCTSETQRRATLPQWLHTYHHHRGHTALAGQPPASRVPHLTDQYNQRDRSALSFETCRRVRLRGAGFPPFPQVVPPGGGVCPEPDSNRHGPRGPTRFKLVVSAFHHPGTAQPAPDASERGRGPLGAQPELIREDLPNSRRMAQRCLILRVADGASGVHGRARGTPRAPRAGRQN